MDISVRLHWWQSRDNWKHLSMWLRCIKKNVRNALFLLSLFYLIELNNYLYYSLFRMILVSSILSSIPIVPRSEYSPRYVFYDAPSYTRNSHFLVGGNIHGDITGTVPYEPYRASLLQLRILEPHSSKYDILIFGKGLEMIENMKMMKIQRAIVISNMLFQLTIPSRFRK